jgi:hypothetical protein
VGHDQEDPQIDRKDHRFLDRCRGGPLVLDFVDLDMNERDVKSKRKPYNGNAGYVASLKCKAPCGGHIVIYDRNKGFDCDADGRWIVMHEPSRLHVSVPSLTLARKTMKDAAAGGGVADILPNA